MSHTAENRPLNHSAAAKWGVCAALAVLVFLVFAQTIRFDFINYDDDLSVYANPTVAKGLTAGSVGWAFTHSQLGHWDPLTTLSHMADCQFYGLRPFGHHLTNVLLHAAAAVLLFVLLLEMTGSFWRCAFVAAAWATHPLRVESVAWVTERKDVLSGVFFMLTLLGYGWYARRPESRARYAVVALCFALGLMSKSMVVTLPFVLLLLDYWPLKRFEAGGAARRLILEKAPLLLLSVILAVVQWKADRENMLSLQERPLLLRIGNAVVSYAVYFRQTVWPANLAAYYPYPSLHPWEVALAALVVGAVSALAIARRKAQPWLLVGWFWFLGMLVPVIGLVQSGDLAHADRYTYLPQIGLFIAGIWTAAEWAGERGHRRLMLGGAVWVCALVLAAFHQTTYWRDSSSLWTHTLECTQDNFLAHDCLGNALAQQGHAEEAMAQFREAIRIYPGDTIARLDLGLVGLALLRQGKTDEAISQFRETLRIDPSFAKAHSNLGIALFQQGRTGEAITEFREAIRIDPNDSEAFYNLGLALLRQGQTDEAISQFRETLRINPSVAEAHSNLGIALFQQGNTGEAITEFREALRINPEFVEAHANLGSLLLQEGQTGEGIEHMRKALALQPGNLVIENNLAWILATAAQPSLRDGTTALQLAAQANAASGGNNPIVLRTLAVAYAATGQYPTAVQTAKYALQLAQAQSNADLAGKLGREISSYEAGRQFEGAQ